jgi:hypothetical protein
MRKTIYRYFSILSVGVFLALAVNAQVPKIDPKAGQRVIVVRDDNFEAQKPTGPVMRRSITCEAWTTTDGILHCKTRVKLKSASIEFKSPTYSSTTPEGTTTSAGGGIGRKLTLKELALDQDTYTWDLSGDKYHEKHAISLNISSAFGSGQVVLINKKVPKEITK